MKTIYNHIPGLPLRKRFKVLLHKRVIKTRVQAFLGESNFPQETEILYLVFGVIGKYHAIKRP